MIKGMKYFLYLLLTYLISGIPFGYILVKVAKGIDVRTVASGNIGATNVTRAAGPLLGAITMILDVLKGFLPTLLALKIFTKEFAIITGIVTVLGHSFTPYLKFRGGKGVSTGFGAFLALFPIPVFIGFFVWITTVLLSRYVSLGSLLGAFSAFLTVTVMERNPYYSSVAFLAFFVIALRHRSNISRLLRGEERKFTIGKR
jgi:glycerol-3-phosphate acyltransferase PlsY